MSNLDYLLDFTVEKHFDFVEMPLRVGTSVIETHQYLQCQDPPFWAFVWPGGQALARYTLDHPEIVRGKNVLEIGPGTGINSIAAARSGAAQVRAVDIESKSADLTSLNAQMNGARQIFTYDYHVSHDELSHYDVILMGDCFYDGEAAYELNKLVDAAVELGVPFYTGDPKREHFPARRATYLEQYGIPDMLALEGKQTVTAYVFELGHI